MPLTLDAQSLPPLQELKIPLEILPNAQLTIGTIDELRQANQLAKRIVIFDNNPFAGVAPAIIEEALLARRAWLRVVDHHGYFNDGVEESAFVRMARSIASLVADRFLLEPTLAITNQGNLDPDGILTLFAMRNPVLALRHAELLRAVTHFTDFSMFGGECVGESYDLNSLPIEKQLGFAMLRRINRQQEELVAEKLSKSLDEASPDEIRGVFIPEVPGEKPEYDASSVALIYQQMSDEYLPRVLNHIEEMGRLPDDVLREATDAVARVKYVARQAHAKSEVVGMGDGFPAGKVALLTPETGLDERLDKPYKVHDWLLEAVGQFVHEAPVYVRTFRGLTVVSVRYARAGEKRHHEFDMRPLTDAINRLQPSHPFYGRKEVSIGRLDPLAVSPEQLVNLILDHWDSIARPIESK